MAMTADDCLANFSVAALMGAPNALAQAEGAIDDYLAPHRFAPLGATAALYALQDAFAAMKIDSTAARSIRELIDDRLRQLAESLLPAARGGDRPVEPIAAPLPE